MSSKAVDFWFDISCPYAYLASTQIDALAKRCQAQLRLRPMLLGGVFRALGNPQNMATGMSAAKAQHNLKDMKRWAARWAVPLSMPSSHPMRTVNALRVLIAAQSKGCSNAELWPLIKGLYRAYWVEHQDIAQPEVLGQVIRAAGLDPEPLQHASQQQSCKDTLRQQTQEAIDLGVFGAPTCVVDNTLYFGQDRLDEVELALGGTPQVVAAARDHRGPVQAATVWFDFSSPFSYLGVMRAEHMLGPQAQWRPMLLGAVFKAVGQANVPLHTMNAPKRRYQGQDLARRAKRWEIALAWPSHFPMRSVLPLRMCLAADPNSRTGRALARAIYHAFWAEDRNISDASVLVDIADALKLDGTTLIARAGDPDIKQALRDHTEAAVASGVFGAPTFVIGEGASSQLFWGADRLELATLTARAQG